MPPKFPEVENYRPNWDLLLYWLVTGQLWRFGKGEDPSWGQRPIDQMTLHASIHELAGMIADEKVRSRVQSAVADGMLATGEAMTKAIVR